MSSRLRVKKIAFTRIRVSILPQLYDVKSSPLGDRGGLKSRKVVLQLNISLFMIERALEKIIKLKLQEEVENLQPQQPLKPLKRLKPLLFFYLA